VGVRDDAIFAEVRVERPVLVVAQDHHAASGHAEVVGRDDDPCVRLDPHSRNARISRHQHHNASVRVEARIERPIREKTVNDEIRTGIGVHGGRDDPAVRRKCHPGMTKTVAGSDRYDAAGAEARVETSVGVESREHVALAIRYGGENFPVGLDRNVSDRFDPEYTARASRHRHDSRATETRVETPIRVLPDQRIRRIVLPILGSHMAAGKDLSIRLNRDAPRLVAYAAENDFRGAAVPERRIETSVLIEARHSEFALVEIVLDPPLARNDDLPVRLHCRRHAMILRETDRRDRNTVKVEARIEVSRSRRGRPASRHDEARGDTACSQSSRASREHARGCLMPRFYVHGAILLPCRGSHKTDRRTDGSSLRIDQISTCWPISITRFGGTPRCRYAPYALRNRKSKMYLRHVASPFLSPMMSVSRPKKYVARCRSTSTPACCASSSTWATVGFSMNPYCAM